MGVYIGGLEIPPKGKGAVAILCSSGAVYSGGQKVGSAIPVPEHGRLIEKNAVFELIRSFPNVDRQLPVEFMKALYELPTILEAEEGE